MNKKDKQLIGKFCISGFDSLTENEKTIWKVKIIFDKEFVREYEKELELHKEIEYGIKNIEIFELERQIKIIVENSIFLRIVNFFLKIYYKI